MGVKKKSQYRHHSPFRLWKVESKPTINYYKKVFENEIEDAKKNGRKPRIPVSSPTFLAKTMWYKMSGINIDEQGEENADEFEFI